MKCIGERGVGGYVIAVMASVALILGPVIAGADDRSDKLQKINHIVVIYQENHSFDNLYGGWEGVNGRANADTAHTQQINQASLPFDCLLQDDVNLTSPSPLPTTCTQMNPSINSTFRNQPFSIDEFIQPTDTTCPAPNVFGPPNGLLKGSGLPGGCTRDLVHRFYQEQYQLNGGHMNRYVTGSDAVGLTMGYYDTTKLPIYKYLHAPSHPKYAIADNFFQGAFGGSFLNHQWLVAAASPVFAHADQSGGANDLHSIVDTNKFPNTYPLYTPTGPVKDAQLTVKCSSPGVPGLACGDYAVNTTQPTYQPFSPGTALARRLPPLATPTIGDRLTAAGVDWAWYSGGWSNANGDIGGPGWTNGTGPNCSAPYTINGAVFPNCANGLFQFHHQPFNYFAAFDPGTTATLAYRNAHLRDEQEFIQLAQSSTQKTCNLKPVSFIKPIGEENEHPGYTGVNEGSNHLVALIDAIVKTACGKDTMIIVTYDEFGGQWDHVPPPGQGNANGPSDQWGPGTRVPGLIVTPFLRGSFVVDHTSYDTTSILATVEKRFGLAPLAARDAAVEDLSGVFGAK